MTRVGRAWDLIDENPKEVTLGPASTPQKACVRLYIFSQCVQGWYTVAAPARVLDVMNGRMACCTWRSVCSFRTASHLGWTLHMVLLAPDDVFLASLGRGTIMRFLMVALIHQCGRHIYALSACVCSDLGVEGFVLGTASWPG